jgi:hypothetical protein
VFRGLQGRSRGWVQYVSASVGSAQYSIGGAGRVRFGWCSDLGSNAFTGSVPSSLSTLTNIYYLCVDPRAARCLCVWPCVFRSVVAAPCAVVPSRARIGRSSGWCSSGRVAYSQGEPCGTPRGLGSTSPADCTAEYDAERNRALRVVRPSPFGAAGASSTTALPEACQARSRRSQTFESCAWPLAARPLGLRPWQPRTLRSVVAAPRAEAQSRARVGGSSGWCGSWCVTVLLVGTGEPCGTLE